MTRTGKHIHPSHSRGEALPQVPGSRVRLIALCVASWWESAPAGYPLPKRSHSAQQSRTCYCQSATTLTSPACVQ
jgi:hypothetical protein